jgi:hypothetical protein
MMNTDSVSARIDQFGPRHPKLMWLTNVILMIFVTVVLLTTTEAPVVLYQAF